MTKLVQTEDKDLQRDVTTMSLLNTNKLALQRHKEEKKRAMEYEQLKNDVEEIKNSLTLILEKLNGR